MRPLILAGLITLVFGHSCCAADPEALPPLEAVYTLRLEESGVNINRPLPAGQKPIDISTVKDELITATEVDVHPGRPFRVRMKRGREVRILSGRPAADWNDQNQLRIEITYAILHENPDHDPDRTSAQAAHRFKIGEPILLGGMTTTGTSTGPDEDREQHQRILINATLLEKTREEEFEKVRRSR